MKRVLLLGVVVFMAMVLFACETSASEAELNEIGAGEANEESSYEYIHYEPDREEITGGEVAIDVIEFLSLEDFLKTHVTSKMGVYRVDFADTWSSQSGGQLKDAIAGTNFVALDILYLPVGIPEDFEIRLITVTDYYVFFRFLPKEIVVTNRNEFWDAAAVYPTFEFAFTRGWGAENPMDGILEQNNATEVDLIGGKYLVTGSNTLTWSSGTELLHMFKHTPLSIGESIAIYDIIDDITTDYADYTAGLTDVEIVNLLDINEVMELIEEINFESISKIVDELTFSSVEEFLSSYIMVKENGTIEEITDLVVDWNAVDTNAGFADVVEGTDFISIETLFKLVNIPEEFHLYRVTVNERNISFRYLHENDLASEETIQEALNQQRYFLFSISGRENEASVLMESVLRWNRATEEDLIEDRYLLAEPNRLVWVSDGAIFRLSVPMSMSDAVGDNLVEFSETLKIDLQDIDAVRDVIAEIAN